MSSYSHRTNQAIALKLHCIRHISRIEVRLYVLTVSPRPVRMFLITGFPRIRTWSSPILTIYTAPLNDVLKRHHMSYHFNADESQTYICPFTHVLVNLNTPNLR